MIADEARIQQDYYTRTAAAYDQSHIYSHCDHAFALAWLGSLIEYRSAASVLDLGSGTGRVLLGLRAKFPALRLVGIEPVAALREVGYQKGLRPGELIAGDATALPFADGAFDLVCAFGTLHHIRAHRQAVSEMLRVSRIGVFISDSNNFGQGSRLTRAVKQALRAAGLWGLVNRLKTRGRGYTLDEHDGLAYSYSVFDSYSQLRRACPYVHFLNTGRLAGAGTDPYRAAGQVAVFARKG